MEDGWYIKRGKDRVGPVTGEALMEMASTGELKPADRIARKGMAKWVEAQTIDGLFAPMAAEIVSSPAKASPQTIEASAVKEPAVVLPVEKPQPPASAKRSALPWILAGVAGGGVLLLGCSGLLCAGIVLLTTGSDDVPPAAAEVASNLASPELEAVTGDLTAAASEPTPDDGATATMQGMLDALKEHGGNSTSAVPPEIAAVVEKAEDGDVESMYELGYRYSEGDGVTVNDAEATRWYQKAVDAGNADAMNDLAYMYLKGRGVAEDPETGAALFLRGAQAGSGMAMFNYAICLGKGRGVEQNDYLCRLWIQKSAETGYEPAQKYMAEVQAQMKAQLLGALVEGLFGGGGGDDSGGGDDRDYFTEQRRQREYWEDRAQRSAAAGDQYDSDYARRQVP